MIFSDARRLPQRVASQMLIIAAAAARLSGVCSIIMCFPLRFPAGTMRQVHTACNMRGISYRRAFDPPGKTRAAL